MPERIAEKGVLQAGRCESAARCGGRFWLAIDSRRDQSCGAGVMAAERTGRHLRWLCVAFPAVVAAAVCWYWTLGRSSLPLGITDAEWREAEVAAVRRLGRAPVRAEVCLTLARQAIRDGQSEKAFVCFAAIPADDPEHGLQAEFERSSLCLEESRAGAAEAGFQKILAAARGGVPVPTRQRLFSLRSLSLLYGVQMRTGRRAEILKQLMDERAADVHEAKYHFFPSLLVWQNDWGASRVRSYLEDEPDSRPLQNAAARYLTGEGRLDDARQQLERLHGADPRDLETVAFLLECCREQNDTARFEAICEGLPAETSAEPLLLMEHRGFWLLGREAWSQAEACFQRLLQRDRANPAACQGLAECYGRLQRPELRAEYMERSAVLARLRIGLGPAVPENPGAIRAVADWSRELGMLDAAEVFDFFAGRGAPTALP